MKSPFKNKKPAFKSSPQKPHNKSNPQTPKSCKFTVPITDTLSTQFQKHIKSNIQLIQSMYNSKVPQKCLTHSLPYTLYCQTDHKVMCSRCMFQNNAHKLHSVRPLGQAFENIHEDCGKLEGEVQNMIAGIQNKKRELMHEKQQIERQYPSAKDTLENIFKQLHQLVFDMENRCVRQLRLFKTMLLQKNQHFTRQIQQIISYLQQQTKKHKKKSQIIDGNQSQLILMKKNILNVIKKSDKIINDELHNSHDKNNHAFKTEKKKKSGANQQIYWYSAQCLTKIKNYFEENIDSCMPWHTYMLKINKKVFGQQKQERNNENQKLKQKNDKRIQSGKIIQNKQQQNQTFRENNDKQSIKNKQKSKFYLANKLSHLTKNMASKSLQSIMRSKSQLFQKNSLLISSKEDQKPSKSKQKIQKNKNRPVTTTQNLLQSLNDNLNEMLNEIKDKSNRKNTTKIQKYQKQLKPSSQRKKNQQQSSKSFLFNRHKQVNKQKVKDKNQTKQQNYEQFKNGQLVKDDKTQKLIKIIKDIDRTQQKSVKKNENELEVKNKSKSRSKSKGKGKERNVNKPNNKVTNNNPKQKQSKISTNNIIEPNKNNITFVNKV